jgi:hypothetical protein
MTATKSTAGFTAGAKISALLPERLATPFLALPAIRARRQARAVIVSYADVEIDVAEFRGNAAEEWAAELDARVAPAAPAAPVGAEHLNFPAHSDREHRAGWTVASVSFIVLLVATLTHCAG